MSNPILSILGYYLCANFQTQQKCSNVLWDVTARESVRIQLHIQYRGTICHNSSFVHQNSPTIYDSTRVPFRSKKKSPGNTGLSELGELQEDFFVEVLQMLLAKDEGWRWRRKMAAKYMATFDAKWE